MNRLYLLTLLNSTCASPHFSFLNSRVFPKCKQIIILRDVNHINVFLCFTDFFSNSGWMFLLLIRTQNRRNFLIFVFEIFQFAEGDFCHFSLFNMWGWIAIYYSWRNMSVLFKRRRKYCAFVQLFNSIWFLLWQWNGGGRVDGGKICKSLIFESIFQKIMSD